MGVHTDIDTIFNQMNTLYAEGRFDKAGDVIKELDVEPLDDAIIIAWMSICLLPKNQGDTLPNRDEFLARCHAELTKRHKDNPGKVARMVKGLM